MYQPKNALMKKFSPIAVEQLCFNCLEWSFNRCHRTAGICSELYRETDRIKREQEAIKVIEAKAW